MAPSAHARPSGPSLACQAYPDVPGCSGQLLACSTCHDSTWPATWNAYGSAVYAALLDAEFDAGLVDALLEVEALDSDDDGVLNVDELALGTNPGRADDVWPWCLPTLDLGAQVPADYDFRRALRRTMVLYCGRSPRLDELDDFDGDGPDDATLHDRLHERLDECLAGDYWQAQALPRLADPFITPIASVGADTTIGITIADYDWDYRLFRYIMTGDRDVRDLLLADYHVIEQGGALVPVPGVQGTGVGGQPLAPEHRAGMITTQWFLARNTMFSGLPRTTAAQAYRAYLGQDIAQQQGLWPVAGEPLDVDDSGVAEGECANCHSTLDPLSYAFAYYEGIAGSSTGTWQAGRPAEVIPGWSDDQAFILGEPVDSVPQWAQAAVDSEMFARNVVAVLYQHALGRGPAVDEQAEFDALWQSLPAEQWRAERMIHRLVDTRAFGGDR
ncbi:MAG: hypothetical protein KDK70_02555 [Myxococcales bacterium]|nr:hypothetical protein [Myxococcales bacterium]